MNQTTLLDWIQNPQRDYEAGLQMLKRIMPLQSPLVRSLTVKPNLEKLMYELEKRIGQTIEKTPPPKFGPKAREKDKAVVLIKSGVDLSEVDFYKLSDLERAQVRRGQLVNERNQLANQLADLTTPPQRKTVRGRMADLQKEIESLSKEIFAHQRGEPKAEKPPVKRRVIQDNPQYKEFRAEINRMNAIIAKKKQRIRAISVRDISETERRAQIKVLQDEIEAFQPRIRELDAAIHNLRYPDVQDAPQS